MLHEGTKKYNRLRRALISMDSKNEDEPLYDADQPEETLKRGYGTFLRTTRAPRRKYVVGNLFNRGLAETMSDIPRIPNIIKFFDKVEPLQPYPKFADFRSEIDNYPKFGRTGLNMINFPRFGAPKMDELETVPGIPHIRPLNRGDEVTGDRRGFPLKNADNEFYDEELDDSVEHITAPPDITAPTSIPYLTDIPSITDIPEIHPIPAVPAKGSGGTKGKMPVVQTVETANGEETRVSA